MTVQRVTETCCSSTTGYTRTTYSQENTGKKKTPSTTFYTTPFQYNYINHTSPDHKNSNRPLTHKCRNGPYSHTSERKPHILPTFQTHQH